MDNIKHVGDDDGRQNIQQRWSTSTAITSAQSAAMDVNPTYVLSKWTTPPLPPIPDVEADMASWRRRSLKRDSYTSHSLRASSAFAATMRQNHRDSVGASLTYHSQRPQSAWRPIASRAKQMQLRAAGDHRMAWANDHENPQNWTRLRKCFQAGVVLLTTFTTTLSSSVLTPLTILEPYEELSRSVVVLPHAIFALGLASVPIMVAYRDGCGRKIALLTTVILFAAFSTVAAFVKPIAVLIVTRFLAGCTASTILAIGPAVLLDIYAAGQRTIPIVLHVTALAGGTSFGPFLRVLAIELQSSAWAQYLILIVLAVAFALICCTSESSKNLILQRRLDTGSLSFSASTLSRTTVQPFRMLLCQSGVWLSASCVAIIAAIAFSLLQAIPIIFRDTYSFDLYLQSCVVFSLGCGFVLALICFAVFHISMYIPKRRRWEDLLAIEVEQSTKHLFKSKSRRCSAHSARIKPSSVYQQSALDRSISAISTCKLQTACELRHDTSSSPPKVTVGLAVAISQELNSDPANQGRLISPERLWTIADAAPSFDHMMEELELKYQFVIDRDRILKMRNAWRSSRASAVLTGDVSPVHERPYSVQTTEQTADTHHAAALAALQRVTSITPTETCGVTPEHMRSKVQPCVIISRQRPPARWRLPLALPGSILATAGIFVLGWTVRPNIHWIVPVMGLAAFGCGGFLCLICISLFLTDMYGSRDIVSAFTVISSLGYMLAFAFSVAIVPIIDSIGVPWAMSILGFCSVIPWPASLALSFSRFASSRE